MERLAPAATRIIDLGGSRDAAEERVVDAYRAAIATADVPPDRSRSKGDRVVPELGPGTLD